MAVTSTRQAAAAPTPAPTEACSMRLLVVTPRFFPYTGGVEIHVYEVARRLAAAGVAVTVLTADTSRRLPRHEQREGVTIERVWAWPSERDYYLAPAIARVVGRGGWDLIHCQSYHTLVAPLAMLAALRAGIPYVVTFHGGGHSSRLRHSARRLQRALLRPLLARAERLVAVAPFEVTTYGRELGIPAERFALIPNGVDVVRSTMPLPPADGTLIASVGRLERYKGHHRILAALPFILKEVPDARLWIAGTGPYEPALRRQAEQLGVSDRVEIRAIPAAERELMARELARAALVTLLSDFETHPLAALEALALGRPVLVADTSGLRDLAQRGLARSVPVTSRPEEVAAAVVEQLRQPLIPGELDLPTWDDCATELLALYRAIVRRHSCAS